MDDYPAVSVCIPTYNRAAMLPAAIDSVLKQHSGNYELLIVDNHSTDRTPEILAQYHDSRIRVVRNDHTVSMYANHNRCACEARAPWLVFLHSDDELAPEALAVLERYQRACPDVQVFYPAKEMHQAYLANGPMRLQGVAGNATLFRWPAGTPTGTMYRTESLRRQPFDESQLAGDLLHLARMLAAGGSLLIIPERIINIGEGAFQATNAWTSSGRFVREVAGVYRAMLQVPQVGDEIVRDVPVWSDPEIARCLMFLAHANQKQLIRKLEARLGERKSYQSLASYRHVQTYRRFGYAGLIALFALRKKLRSLGI